jgi:Na+/glutamate symporter
MILGWVIGFFRFWYHFIVGDDWMIAAAVALGLVVVFALSRAQIEAWWLMPIAVPLTLILSLCRARRERA